MIDIKTHIEQTIRNAAITAKHDVQAEELRLTGLGQKIAGPFERFARAIRAGWAAFEAVRKSNP